MPSGPQAPSLGLPSKPLSLPCDAQLLYYQVVAGRLGLCSCHPSLVFTRVTPIWTPWSELRTSVPEGCCAWLHTQMVQHGDYTEKVDIFSLGCLMYELFSRQLCAANLLARSGGDGGVLKQHAMRVRARQQLALWSG